MEIPEKYFFSSFLIFDLFDRPDIAGVTIQEIDDVVVVTLRWVLIGELIVDVSALIELVNVPMLMVIIVVVVFFYDLPKVKPENGEERKENNDSENNDYQKYHPT
mmetsp:Transcript_39043/g.54451  ORF Transcript_39043/g.54451 Transcript_39043/m.54451 type:complete len:105 (-) Transcript_39043:415-729(-)